jgi:hypothetical protein
VTEERRSEERIPLNLPARYDGLSGAQAAQLDDLSGGGCFVNTRGQVNPGEVIAIEIKMPSGEWLELRGEVTSCQPGIGFGMAFTFLTDEEERILQHLITA